MKKVLILILISFISILSSEEMTVEKFKKIMKGKESKTVRKELQFMPLLKKHSMTCHCILGLVVDIFTRKVTCQNMHFNPFLKPFFGPI